MVDMRSVAVLGAGIAGLIAAHGLRRAGYSVTLYSDRTPEQWLTSRPTGTAARFGPALAYERELGLAHWEAQAARRVIGALTGEWWLRSVVAGALGVVGSQLRKKLLRGVR